MARRTYTDAEKTGALKLYLEHGPGEASRRCGVPRGTISKWAHEQQIGERRNERTSAATEAARASFAGRREQLKQKLLDKANELLDRMDEPHQEFVGQHGSEVRYDRAPAQAVKAYATSVGILIDKMRLELGEHTASQRNEDVSQMDRDIERLLTEFDQRDAVANGNGNGHHASG